MLELVHAADQPRAVSPGRALNLTFSRGLDPEASRTLVVPEPLSRAGHLESTFAGYGLVAEGGEEFRAWLYSSFALPQLERIRSALNKSPEAVASAAIYLIVAGRAAEALAFVHSFRSSQREFWTEFAFARALVAVHRTAEAESVLQEFFEMSRDERAVHALARLYLEQAKYSDVENALAKVAERSANPHLWNDYGVALIGLGRYPQAINVLRHALTFNERDAMALNNIGICYAQLKRDEKARLFFSEALKVQPKLESARKNLAESLIASEKFTEAIDLLEASPLSSSATLEHRAWCWYQLGHLSRAKALLLSAASADKSNSALLNNLGIIQMAGKDLDAAQESLRQAITLSPKNPDIAMNLSILYASTGRLREATSLLLPWAATPEHSPAELLLRLSNLLSQLKRYSDAIELLEKAIQVHPSVENLWANLGFVLTCRLEDPQRAIDVLERGLQENAPALRIRNNLAYALLLTGHFQRAREVLEPTTRFLDTRPSDAESRSFRVYLLATWGLLWIREGNFVKGLELYREALRSATGELQRRVQQKIHVEEARHEIAAGHQDRAQRLLQKAIRNNADPEFTKEAQELSVSTYRQ